MKRAGEMLGAAVHRIREKIREAETKTCDVNGCDEIAGPRGVCFDCAVRAVQADSFRSEVPKAFQGWRLTDFPEVSVPDLRLGLLIGGEIGTGKSSLAAAIAYRDSVDEKRGMAWRLAPEMVDDLVSAVTQASARDAATSRSLLVIDDLGSERDTDSSRAAIRSIVTARMDAERPTIVTTNVSAVALARRDPRLFDRLRTFAPIHLSGQSRRRRLL